MSAPQPFFYERAFLRFMAHHEIDRQLLVGGRGIGKSAWLRRFAAEFGERCVWLDHRDLAQRDERQLAPKVEYVLLDGLDKVVRQSEARARLLRLIRQEFNDKRVKIIATSRLDRGALCQEILNKSSYDFFSDWVGHFSAERINPWPWNWRALLRVQLDTVEWMTDPLAEELLHLSGGHPALLGAGVDLLELELSDPSLNEPWDSTEQPPPLTDAVAEAMMERARPLAEKLIFELEHGAAGPGGQAAAEARPNPVLERTRRDALALLVEVINGTPPSGSPSYLARNHLLASGLVYEREGRLQIPGPLLREVFVAGLGRESSGARLLLRARDDAGQISWRRADGAEDRFELEGKSWAIFRCLAEARASEQGQAIWSSPKAIAARLPNVREAYVRVVVRRIREHMQPDGDDVIVTDRSQGGYRITLPVEFL